MSTKRTLAILAATSVLALSAMAPVYAEDIVKEEQDQIGNSTEPDVDPGASRGPDSPIPDQERMQLGNSPGPDVPSRTEEGGPSVDEQIKEGIEE